MNKYELLSDRQKKIYDFVKAAYDKNGKKRHDGSEYFGHCWRVWLNYVMLSADRLSVCTEEWRDMLFFVILSHDTLEDNIIQKNDIKKFFFEVFSKGGEFSTVETIWEHFERAMNIITHVKDESYEKYIENIAKSFYMWDDDLIILKISDILDNLSCNPTDKQRAKYRAALEHFRRE